jgi:hypothetical protein
MATQTERRYFKTKKEVTAWLTEQGVQLRRPVTMSRGEFTAIAVLPPGPTGTSLVSAGITLGPRSPRTGDYEYVHTLDGDGYEESPDGGRRKRPLTAEEQEILQRRVDRMNELKALARGTNVSIHW